MKHKGISKLNKIWKLLFKKHLPKTVKIGPCGINIYKYGIAWKHWVGFNVKIDHETYLYSFGVEHVPKEIKNFIGNNNIKANIFRT